MLVYSDVTLVLKGGTEVAYWVTSTDDWSDYAIVGVGFVRLLEAFLDSFLSVTNIYRTPVMSRLHVYPDGRVFYGNRYICLYSDDLEEVNNFIYIRYRDYLLVWLEFDNADSLLLIVDANNFSLLDVHSEDFELSGGRLFAQLMLALKEIDLGGA